MKLFSAFVACTFLSLNVSAATLEGVVAALALPSNADYSANDWPSTNKIIGVKWNHKGLRETPAAPFTRSGKIKLQHLGNASVFFSGARTMVVELNVDVSEGDGNIFEKSDFTSVLKSQFSKPTIIKLIRKECSDEDGISGSAVYEVTLPSKKPLYTMISTDSGGSSPNSRTSSFQFSLNNEDRWSCNP